MSAWLWILIIAVGWVALALVIGRICGPIFKRNRKRYPKPPHIESPAIPEQRTGPQRRKTPQNWPYKNGHSK